MSVVMIRLPNDQLERLKTLEQTRGVSLNKLFEEFATKALTEFDVEARFRAPAARGDRQRGIALLDKLDRAE